MTSKNTNGPDLIGLAIASVGADTKAHKARVALIDALVAEGFTFDLTAAYTDKALREGKATSENKRFRDRLMTIALSAITIKGKRLTLAEVAEAMAEDRAAKRLIKGTPIGTISGVTTWRGDATSQLGKWRKDLKTREAESETEGAAKTTKTPLLLVREALAKIEAKVTKAEPGAFEMDIPKFLESLRALNKLVK